MTNRERIAQAIPAGEPGDMIDVNRQHIADAILADLRAGGFVIMPAIPTVRLRHEASKGAVGMTPGTFAAMWASIVAYARTLDR